MERRLAAILAADVVGFSKLMGEDESGTLSRLKAHRADVFDPAMLSHNGRIIKLMGDGTLVEFSSVVDAVQCAISIQKIQTQTKSDIQLRIGVNVGDVMIDGDDVYGDGVNVAARLESLAEPGGICISEIVYQSLDTKLNATFKSTGNQTLKNIERPVATWQWSSGIAAQEIGHIQLDLRLPDRPSIAVLPFNNMSADPDQDYFSDGITEDIITELSRFSGLFVIARNSSFAYKGKAVDIKQITHDLGVRYLLVGSVRKGGERLRIAIQLLDSIGGGQVWGEKFDCELGDVFDLQDQITRSVVSSIAPQIELAELERSRKLSGSGLNAYELALKAQALFYDAVRVADPKTLDQARSIVDSALALDSRNIHALWTKCLILFYQHVYRWGEDPDGALTSFSETAEYLIRIDSSNAKSYMVRAWSQLYHRKFDAALADHHRALALNPNLASNLFAMAWSEAIAGLPVEAREHVQLALRLSPRETDIWLGEGYAALALASFVEGDYNETIKWGHLANQMQPITQGLMVAANAFLGDIKSAKLHMETLNSFAPDFLPAVLSDKIEVCKLPEHNKLLKDGLSRVE